MKIKFAKPIAEAVAKRAFWLAWKACGGSFGMGIFQDRPTATEEDVWRNVMQSGDYAGFTGSEKGDAYGDYVFGRMMKLNIRYGADWVDIPDSKAERDYQSWSRKYPTYEALMSAAVADLAGEMAETKK